MLPVNPVNPVQNLSSRIISHLAEYYNLGFNRKPEHMCVQWTTNLPASVKSSLLNRYHALIDEDLAIEEMFTNLNCHNCSQITNTIFNSQLTTHNFLHVLHG